MARRWPNAACVAQPASGDGGPEVVPIRGQKIAFAAQHLLVLAVEHIVRGAAGDGAKAVLVPHSVAPGNRKALLGRHGHFEQLDVLHEVRVFFVHVHAQQHKVALAVVRIELAHQPQLVGAQGAASGEKAH